MKITRFNKAIVTGIALILNTVVVAMGDDVVDMTERQHVITTVVTVVLSIAAVWRVPNTEEADKGTDVDDTEWLPQ